MPVKVLLGLKIDAESRYPIAWSETYINTANPSSLENMRDIVSQLIRLRADLSSFNVSVTFARLSRIGSPRRVKKIYTTAAGGQDKELTGEGGMTGKASDVANSCLAIDLFAGESQRGGIRMAGIPDAIIQTAPAGPNFSGAPGWKGKFNAWAAFLKAGTWAFRTRVVPNDATQQPIQLWQNSADAPYALQATVNAGDPTTWRVGVLVQVSGVTSLQRGGAVPRGEYKITARAEGVPGPAFTLGSAIGYDPATFRDNGRLTLVQYEYATITGVEVNGQQTRKRGVGPLRRRGRSPVRRTA